MEIFSEAVERVGREYEALGHQLGWRFLYSPANTLSTSTQILFLGKNPGGGRYVAPVASVEEGNAYRLERWGGHDNYNPLQNQVQKLFGILAKKLEQQSSADLMDKTLTSNFCPFRSSGWPSLHRRSESISFSVVVDLRPYLTFGNYLQWLAPAFHRPPAHTVQQRLQRYW